jgi:two-component system NtrC family sensor kinase
VFLNLILNAMQAMPEGGTLSIRTRQETEGIRVEIGDSGPGIPPDVVDQIFDPFYTTKPQGTGLGLPLSLKIVTDHGGRIQVDSPPGRGTILAVHLPLIPPTSPR